MTQGEVRPKQVAHLHRHTIAQGHGKTGVATSFLLGGVRVNKWAESPLNMYVKERTGVLSSPLIRTGYMKLGI